MCVLLIDHDCQNKTLIYLFSLDEWNKKGLKDMHAMKQIFFQICFCFSLSKNIKQKTYKPLFQIHTKINLYIFKRQEEKKI